MFEIEGADRLIKQHGFWFTHQNLRKHGHLPLAATERRHIAVGKMSNARFFQSRHRMMKSFIIDV